MKFLTVLVRRRKIRHLPEVKSRFFPSRHNICMDVAISFYLTVKGCNSFTSETAARESKTLMLQLLRPEVIDNRKRDPRRPQSHEQRCMID